MHSLIAELVRVIMEPAAEKKVFGARYITCRRYLGCYEQAFEFGAVLGRAFGDRLPTLAQLFCDPGVHPKELASGLRQAAEDFTEIYEPKSFLDLAMWHEQSRVED